MGREAGLGPLRLASLVSWIRDRAGEAPRATRGYFPIP